MGLIPISLDAISITFRDSPFVKGSPRFFYLYIRYSNNSGVFQLPDSLQTSFNVSCWLRIILSTIHFSDYSLIITVHKDSRYWFFNHRQVRQELTQPLCLCRCCIKSCKFSFHGWFSQNSLFARPSWHCATSKGKDIPTSGVNLINIRNIVLITISLYERIKMSTREGWIVEPENHKLFRSCQMQVRRLRIFFRILRKSGESGKMSG
jgi:hypothetical protein